MLYFEIIYGNYTTTNISITKKDKMSAITSNSYTELTSFLEIG